MTAHGPPQASESSSKALPDPHVLRFSTVSLNSALTFKEKRELQINKLKNKILGITCHNSKILAKDADKLKADYIAFGSFFKSRLKPNAKKADLSVLRWAKKEIKKPIVVIGGINNLNYKKLIKAGAKYIAISSFIWDNRKLKPEFAIRKFK